MISSLPPRAIPIIVIGVNRSGTKWLSNEIASHPEVAAVQADVHGGILESNLLTDYGRAFDLSNDHDWERLLDFWERTHFFQLIGGDRDWLESIVPRPSNSVALFRVGMDHFADRHGLKWWVQKIAPADTDAVFSALPDAKVVAIRRMPVDAVRSRIRLDSGRGIKTGPGRAAMSAAIQVRQMERAISGRDAMLVEYESLLSDRSATMNAVFNHLGLDPLPGRSTFAPNTSFVDSGDRRSTLGLIDEATVRLFTLLCDALPYRLLKGLQSTFSRKGPDIIPGTFAQEDPL